MAENQASDTTRFSLDAGRPKKGFHIIKPQCVFKYVIPKQKGAVKTAPLQFVDPNDFRR